VRLAGALLIEQNVKWLVGRRYLSVESLQTVLARARAADKLVEAGALPAAGRRDHPDERLTGQNQTLDRFRRLWHPRLGCG
jgi:hypothetical protein